MRRRKQQKKQRRNNNSKPNHNEDKTNNRPKKKQKVLDPFWKPYRLKPRSDNQEDLIRSIKSNTFTCVHGPAGCGKTHIAVGVALQLYKSEFHFYDKIVLARPAVEGGGERLGFMPGDAKTKVGNYIEPLNDELSYYISKSGLAQLKSEEKIKIQPLAFIRGKTFNNAIIIVDEAQNATYEQLKMVWTRLGIDSKLIFLGDVAQSDLKKFERGGYAKLLKRMKGVHNFEIAELDIVDIQRNAIVRDMLERDAELDEEEENAASTRNEDASTE